MPVYLDTNTSAFRWEFSARDEGETGGWSKLAVLLMSIDTSRVGGAVTH